MQPVVSVIIASRNGSSTIAEAVGSLLEQEAGFPWEIVLADNGSTDATRAVFLDHVGRVPNVELRVVDAGQRRGKSYALNVAIDAARADKLLFLDDDDTVAPGWLRHMAAALDRDPFVAARFDTVALNPGVAIAPRGNPQDAAVATLPYAPYCAVAGGGSLGFRRHVFDRLGGFDEDVACIEDGDFCVRAHLAGFRLRFVPEAVYNYRFRSDPMASRRQMNRYARGNALLRKRYAGERRFIPLAWASLAFNFAKAITGRALRILTGNGRDPRHLMLYNAEIGNLTGDLAGALAYGVSPGRRGFGGLLTRLRSARTSVAELAMAPWAGSLVAVRTRHRLASLTFDDGPDPDSTPHVLDALAAVGAKATFFVIGARARRHPDLIARIIAEGHEIGNHTFTHPSLPTVAPDRAAGEIARARDVLAPAGQALMRPPYGDQTFAVNRAARRLGYRPVLWNVSGNDWLDADAETLADRICAELRPGSIVLLHDSLFSFEDPRYRDRTPTIEAIGRIAAALPDMRFVTVSDLVATGAPIMRARVKRSDPDYLRALDVSGDASDVGDMAAA